MAEKLAIVVLDLSTARSSSKLSNPAKMLLNERQLEVLVQKVKDDIDVPLMSESLEDKIIDKLVMRIAPKVEPALSRFVPEAYLDCIRYALKEEIPLETRRAQITEILQEKIGIPLAEELNADTDIKFIPSELEGVLMKSVAKKFVEEVVEWTVGTVDETFKESEE